MTAGHTGVDPGMHRGCASVPSSVLRTDAQQCRVACVHSRVLICMAVFINNGYSGALRCRCCALIQRMAGSVGTR